MAVCDGYRRTCNNDGIALAHHFFDVGHYGNALNDQQQIAEDIESKGYSYSAARYCLPYLETECCSFKP